MDNCKRCGQYVRHGGIFCMGLCQSWLHLKCINLSYSSVKVLTKEQLDVWKCQVCAQDTESSILDLETENSNSKLELSLASEIESAILHENEKLKQELHDLKNSKATYVLELEDKIKEQDEEIKSLTTHCSDKEAETEVKLKSMESTLSITRKQIAELIFQAEHDKNHFDLELDKLRNFKCTSCKIYNDEIKKMLDSIKSLETATKMLQNENDLLVDQIKKKDDLNVVCLNCFPPLSSHPTLLDERTNKEDTANNTRYTQITYCSNTKLKQQNLENAKKKRFPQLLRNVPNFETKNPFSPLAVDDVSETPIVVDKEVPKPKTKNRRRMLLCADSHGRDLAWHINNNSKTLDAYGFIKPGGRAHQILSPKNIEGEKLEEGSFVVVACGTNDVACNKADSAIDIISSTVKCMKNTVILLDLPLRHDLPVWSCVNKEIRRTNNELLRLSEKVSNVTLIKASQAHRSLHTQHGLHLNHRGKQWLAGKICEAAESTTQPLPPGCDISEEPEQLFPSALDTLSENLSATATNHRP